MRKEFVVLVDEYDRETGVQEKLQAHLDGQLHRAISVFVSNSRGEMLLQRRAPGKYHSAGLWTNTCCSHPRPNEQVHTAAQRRLFEEMGIITALVPAFTFVYKAVLDNGITEYEYDHVFRGVSDMIPEPNADEVCEWKYADYQSLKYDMEQRPDHYTEWFKICLRQHAAAIIGK